MKEGDYDKTPLREVVRIAGLTEIGLLVLAITSVCAIEKTVMMNHHLLVSICINPPPPPTSIS